MAFSTSAALTTIFFLLLTIRDGIAKVESMFNDTDYVELALNLEYLETEFFLWGALGYGLDHLAPNLTVGGPPPYKAQKANLSPFINDIVEQFGYQEMGHLRAIKGNVTGFPRPQLDLSVRSFAAIMDKAFGYTLNPPFNPYVDDTHYLLASYIIPYVGLTGYVGASPNLQTPTFKRLVAGLLGVESGQDAVIRTLLYQRWWQPVEPYPYLTVAEFTNNISSLRNNLGNDGLKDEGIRVEKTLGAEGKTEGNVLAGNEQSLSYDRTPAEILRIVYGSGNEEITGGFFPNGADGKIAKSYLKV